MDAGRQLFLALLGLVSYDLRHTRPWKKNYANCKLRILSGVTLNCQATMIVMNTSSQLKHISHKFTSLQGRSLKVFCFYLSKIVRSVPN